MAKSIRVEWDADGMETMARVDIEVFEGQELSRVYIAGVLKEAKHVEEILTANSIAYAIEIEPYRKLLLGIIPREYHGAGFFVRSADAPLARSALIAAGLKAGIQE